MANKNQPDPTAQPDVAAPNDRKPYRADTLDSGSAEKTGDTGRADNASPGAPPPAGGEDKKASAGESSKAGLGSSIESLVKSITDPIVTGEIQSVVEGVIESMGDVDMKDFGKIRAERLQPS